MPFHTTYCAFCGKKRGGNGWVCFRFFGSSFLASGSVFGEGKGRVGSGCGRIGREGCGKD